LTDKSLYDIFKIFNFFKDSQKYTISTLVAELTITDLLP